MRSLRVAWGQRANTLSRFLLPQHSEVYRWGRGGQLRARSAPPAAASLQPQRPRRPGAGSWRPASHGLPLPFPAETQDGGQQSGTSQRPEMTGQRVGAAGRVCMGPAGGPLSTLALCHRDPPPDLSAHRRGQRRGLRKQTLSRGSDMLTHMRVRAFAHPRSHMLTHTHTGTLRPRQEHVVGRWGAS